MVVRCVHAADESLRGTTLHVSEFCLHAVPAPEQQPRVKTPLLRAALVPTAAGIE